MDVKHYHNMMKALGRIACEAENYRITKNRPGHCAENYMDSIVDTLDAWGFLDE